MERNRKPLCWLGSSLEALQGFPVDVRKVMGFALTQAQEGQKHVKAKPLKGFGGAGVMEIIADYEGNTYRCIYAIKFSTTIYVLHAFQKKSRKGAETPKPDMRLIQQRLKVARADDMKKKIKGIKNASD